MFIHVHYYWIDWALDCNNIELIYQIIVYMTY